MFGLFAVLGFLASAYQQVEASKAAERQAEASNRQFELRRKASEEAYKKEVFAVRAQEIEQQAEVAAQAEQITREALSAKGVALASAGSANVGGMAVADAINDFNQQEAGTLSRLNLFQEFRSGQTEQAVRNAASSNELRVLSFLPGPTIIPQFGVAGAFQAVGFGLQIGAGAQKLSDSFQAAPSTIPQTNSSSYYGKY